MKAYNKEVLKDAAHRLLFDMSESEYDTLLDEFNIITKQMLVIGEDPSIDQYKPMTFPFVLDRSSVFRSACYCHRQSLNPSLFVQ